MTDLMIWASLLGSDKFTEVTVMQPELLPCSIVIGIRTTTNTAAYLLFNGTKRWAG